MPDKLFFNISSFLKSVVYKCNESIFCYWYDLSESFVSSWPWLADVFCVGTKIVLHVPFEIAVIQVGIEVVE